MKKTTPTIFFGILGLISFLAFVGTSISFAETTTAGTESETHANSSGSGQNTLAQTVTSTTVNTVTNTTAVVAPAAQILKTMSIDPQSPIVEAGSKVSFKARMASGEGLSDVTWMVYEANGGSISREGSYLTPSIPGVFHVVARSPGFVDRAVSVTVRAPIAQTSNTSVGQNTGTSVTTVTTVTTPTVPVPTPTPVTTLAPVPITTVTTPVTTTVTTSISNTVPVATTSSVPGSTVKVETVKTTESPKIILPAANTATGEATVNRVSTTTTRVEVQKPVTPVKPVTSTVPAVKPVVPAIKEIKEEVKRGEGNATTGSTSVATSTLPAPATTSARASADLRDISSKVEDAKATLSDSKDLFIKIVDQRISEAMRENGSSTTATSTAALKAVRDRLQSEIDSGLTPETAAAPDRIKELGTKISDGLAEISRIASTTPDIQGQTATSSRGEADKALESLVNTIGNKADTLKQSGADLLYKDSNSDGISDYESVHIYNIDPVKPSPVTVSDGRQVTAGEKVLLGFDPSKTELVKVEKEEPRVSSAPIATAYKVTEVRLAPETKKVVLKGKALPNSFITLYIYSTPIIVTVKTNSDGEWDYTLDKELDTGEHTVYTANVNNSGKIVARSSGFTFTKTAEAATLDTVPGGVPASAEIVEPTVLESNTIYIIIVAFLSIVLVAIGLIGVAVK